MDAKIIDKGIGSVFAVDCACGREVRVLGPCHIQSTRVTCECGAVYEFTDPGDVKVLVPGIAPKAKARPVELEPEPEVIGETWAGEPVTIEPPKPKPKKGKK